MREGRPDKGQLLYCVATRRWIQRKTGLRIRAYQMPGWWNVVVHGGEGPYPGLIASTWGEVYAYLVGASAAAYHAKGVAGVSP